MGTLRRMVARGLMVSAVLLPLLLVVLYAVNPFAAQSLDPRQRMLGYGLYRSSSDSMLPTLGRDALVLTHAGYYARHAPQRGEVVVMRFIEGEREQQWLKRVIALPGEQVEIRAGQVLVNGHVLDEPYVEAARRVSEHSLRMGALRVPVGQYFVLGDNRDNSHDSRLFGCIPRRDLLGRVAMVLGQ